MVMNTCDPNTQEVEGRDFKIGGLHKQSNFLELKLHQGPNNIMDKNRTIFKNFKVFLL